MRMRPLGVVITGVAAATTANAQSLDDATFRDRVQPMDVANAGSLSAVDIKTGTEMTRVPVGQVPKRTITATWRSHR
jgi:hypothetical protein